MDWRILLFLIVVCADSNLARQTCRPTCDPPLDFKGCYTFIEAEKCDDDDSSETSVSVTECGCLWKSFIQSLVEPERYSVFTPDGIQCFVWAMNVCEAHEYVTTTTPEPTQILDVETGDIYGKVDGVKGKYQTADMIDQVVFEENHGSTGYGIKAEDTSSRHDRSKTEGPLSIYWGMNHEKFKLGVFAVILLFNVVCVVVAVCCRFDSKTREKEARLAGDLDPKTYMKKMATEKPARTVSIDKFLEKFRQYKDMKIKKKENSYGILKMDYLEPINKHQPMFTPGPYRGVYNSTDEHSDGLDTTYEEPMHSQREIIHSKIRRKDLFSDDDEDTIYENVRPRDNNKSVSFQVPKDATPDQKMRVPAKKSKKGEKIYIPTMKWTN